MGMISCAKGCSASSDVGLGYNYYKCSICIVGDQCLFGKSKLKIVIDILISKSGCANASTTSYLKSIFRVIPFQNSGTQSCETQTKKTEPIDRLIRVCVRAGVLSYGPPFASLATKGDLPVTLCQERVFEIKDRVRDLVTLDSIDSLSAPDGGDFRNQIRPLALGLGCFREIIQVPVGVFHRQLQRDEFPDESFSVVLHTELCEEV